MAKKVSFSLGQKATLLILVFAFILGFSTILFGYQSYSRSVDAHFALLGADIAKSAANFVDPDSIGRYVETGETDAQYDRDLKDLRNFIVDKSIEYVFLFRPTEEGQLYIFDTDETPERYPLGYVEKWSDYPEIADLVPGFLAGEEVGTMTSNEAFGWILTIYEPVYDSNGDVTAYMGVDMSMDSVLQDKQDYLLSLILLTAVITAGFSVLYVLVIRKIIVSPINKMARAADAYLVEQDVHTLDGVNHSSLTDLQIFSRDELGSLADSLQSMERKINEYIQNLDVATKKAETDSLTGLYNREAFNLRTNSVLFNGADADHVHAFMMIDLDDYKSINDTYGHLVGDEVLQKAAFALKHTFRASDVVARMGGDEFAVFMNSVGEVSRVREKAAALGRAFRDITVEGAEGMRVTASIGVAVYPQDGLTAEELYEKADTALYAVKTSSKGCYMMAADAAGECPPLQ